MDFPTNTSHHLGLCLSRPNVVRKSNWSPKARPLAEIFHRTIAANRRIVISVSNTRREKPTKAWRIATSDDQVWMTTGQRLKWTERAVCVFELCFMMKLNVELLAISPRRAKRSIQYIPFFTLMGSKALKIWLSITRSVYVNITYLIIWWIRIPTIMKPNGLHFSFHTNGSRHMAAAAATQVNRMRYNFMVRLKNTVSMMAMEGGRGIWHWTTHSYSGHLDAEHRNVTACQIFKRLSYHRRRRYQSQMKGPHPKTHLASLA